MLKFSGFFNKGVNITLTMSLLLAKALYLNVVLLPSGTILGIKIPFLSHLYNPL